TAASPARTFFRGCRRKKVRTDPARGSLASVTDPLQQNIALSLHRMPPLPAPNPERGCGGRGPKASNELFVSQSIDGIELRRFAGGIKTEENAHGRAADERKNDRLGRNQSRPILDGSDQPRAADAHSNAQQAADGAQGHGFDKKLQENVAA